ncbi:hypothetical protein ABZ687_28870 [Streptomyces ardesiacus]|uniref:hypothetical protein n=1 Tax=Streptomyces ardesiacus TaxID=285564 RepID=UPI0033E91D6D
MSNSHTEKLDIIVGNFPTDAALYNINGVRTLFMSSAQTFSNAVENVRNVLPGITLEAAERMIREQCPEFKDLDDLLGRNAPTLPSVERPAPEPAAVDKEQPPGKRRRKVALVAALLPALAASWALGRYTHTPDTAPADSAKTATTAPDAAGADHEKAPFEEPRFTRFAGVSSIDCDPISPLEAECTDADGKVMSTKAATGPDSTVFTFSYGSERIGLRIFYDADYAGTWARQDGTKDLYPHLEMHGRYALWGTDPARVKDYGDLLSASGTGDMQAMGAAVPLPPRLAALTLGTLGLDQREVHQLLAQSPTPVPADTPTIVAARLVLGLDQAPRTPSPATAPEGEDIVAIAAGIEPVPSTGEKTAPATEPSSSGNTVAAGGTTGTGSGTPQPSRPTTRPSTQPSTGTGTSPSGSEKPTEPSTPPAETKPPETTKPPTTPPPSTTPPADTAPPKPDAPADPTPSEPTAPEAPTDTAPTEPPAEETPVPPAGENPPPDEEQQPPAEETPDPAEETAVPVDLPTATDPSPPAPGADGDDLLILPSAWTVAAA